MHLDKVAAFLQTVYLWPSICFGISDKRNSWYWHKLSFIRIDGQGRRVDRKTIVPK